MGASHMWPILGCCRRCLAQSDRQVFPVRTMPSPSSGVHHCEKIVRKLVVEPSQDEAGRNLRTLELPSHWTPTQALAAFEILDELRDLIWHCHGWHIQQVLRRDRVATTFQIPANIDDGDVPFRTVLDWVQPFVVALSGDSNALNCCRRANRRWRAARPHLRTHAADRVPGAASMLMWSRQRAADRA